MTERVLILGAAGRLGQALCQAFSEAGGWTVLAQARKPLPHNLPRVQALSCEALDTATLLAQAQGATVVINALNPPYTRWEALWPPLALAALQTAQGLNALLMLPGNVYNYGHSLPEQLHLHTPEQGNTPKARVRIALEAQMAAAAPELDSVVLRAGDFFGGSGSGTWMDLALLTQLHKGRFVYPGPLDQSHAWAYLPDLAATFVKLAQQRARLRGHHHLNFPGHSVEGQVLQQALEQLCGMGPLQAKNLPWGLIRLGAALLPNWRALCEMRYLWDRPHRLVDGGELSVLIGSIPHTALLPALRSCLPPQLRSQQTSPALP